MKKTILSFSLALLGLTATFRNASAQEYDRRVDVARIAVEENRTYYRGDSNRDWDRRGSRAAQDLERLNREVRQVRAVINFRGVSLRTRDRFRRVLRATDYLNEQFRRGNLRGPEVRRRADVLRAELDRVRFELRARRIGRGVWW